MATRKYLGGSVIAADALSSDQDLGLSAAAGASAASRTIDTVAGPATLQLSNASGFGPISWWFKAGAVTISGTITFNLWALESAMANNAGLRAVIDRCDSTGAFISNIVTSSRGVELGTSAAANNWTATPTSTTLSNGDYIRVRVYAVDAGGTMAAATAGVTVRYNGTVATTAESWVEFTETVPAASYSGSPPATNRINWYKADSLGLADGAQVPTWNDEDGNANLTKQAGGNVVYHDGSSGGANGMPYVTFVFNGGGMDGVRAADSGAVLGLIIVLWNQWPTGTDDIKGASSGGATDFWLTEPNIGGYQFGGATGAVGTGGTDTSTSQWSILLCVWDGSSSALYQNGGTAKATGTVTGTNGTGVNIGGSVAGQFWGGKIAEEILYATNNPNTLNDAAKYAAAKYGLTWTDIPGITTAIERGAGAQAGLWLPSSGAVAYGAGDA